MEIITTDTYPINNNDINVSSEIIDNLNSYELSEEEKNYRYKKKLIDSNEFVEMRKLEKSKRFILKDEKINTNINRDLIKNILLPKLYITYQKFASMLGDSRQSSILDICKKNSKQYIKDTLYSERITNKKLRKCAKLARGETFLFTTNTNKDKYIRLEIEKTEQENDLDILKGQEYFVRRHIDEDTDITLMSDILLQGKIFLDFYLADKNIRYLISSSRLFDDEFNDFLIQERAKEGNVEIPNRVKIREESLQYGGKLLSEEPNERAEEKFIDRGKDTSLTRAVKEYSKQGKHIKDGGGYIDLQALERWEKEHSIKK